MVRNYTKNRQDEYTYIVIDEAHHAVAPMLKRVIQYFTPEFMVGLTATDQRTGQEETGEHFRKLQDKSFTDRCNGKGHRCPGKCLPSGDEYRSESCQI